MTAAPSRPCPRSSSRLAERDPDATLADYVRWSEDEDFEATPLLEYRTPGEDRLTLTTLHQAKGEEYQVVVIADATEGVFPDLRTRESLLGVRHLSRTQPTDQVEYARFRLQEEMRLAYTAMVRASRRVIWTATSQGAEDGRGRPSRFLPLVRGATTVAAAIAPPTDDHRPVTPFELEAHLRRLVRDPGRPGPQRLAALTLLSSDDIRRGRSAREFAGALHRGPDHGVVGARLRLSPSRAESYRTCGRRYVFESHLGIGRESTVYTELGSQVHAALEAAERAATARGQDHALLDDALASLGAVWDPAPFGGGAWAAAWRRRAERILTHLYEQWPGRGPAVALEHPVEANLHGVLWRGRIDRIERDPGGGLVIVDYKTSSRAAPKAEAARSVQLGFYAIAVNGDDTIAGDVVAAELWYPAHPTKGVAVRSLDLDDLDGVDAVLRETAEGIAAEHWDPQTGPHCDRCSVRRVCPAWPEGREAFAS
jgi:RecB family exonuclease